MPDRFVLLGTSAMHSCAACDDPLLLLVPPPIGYLVEIPKDCAVCSDPTPPTRLVPPPAPVELTAEQRYEILMNMGRRCINRAAREHRQRFAVSE